MDESEEFIKDLGAKAWDTLFGKIDETEVVILKGHLLLELALNHSIEIITQKRLNIEKSGFTFYEKVKICRMLGIFSSEIGKDNLLFIENLNQLRNQVAHRLTFEQSLFDKVCDVETYKNFEGYNLTRNNLLNSLKLKITWVCGQVVGFASGIANV